MSVLTHFVVWAMMFLLASPVQAEEKKLRHVAAKDCSGCHQQIYDQWKHSMHANSTALSDPIHGAFYQKVMGDPLKEGLRKQGKYPVCLKCHVPAAARDGKTKMDALPAYQDGVGCTTCHSMTAFKGVKNEKGGLRLGVDAYAFSDNVIQASSDSNFHPEIESAGQKVLFKMVGNSTVLKTNAVCMGCHERRNNLNKVPLCQTGDEIASAPGSTDCQLCHMPVTNGVVDHSFMGGHTAKMVSRGLLMTMKNEEVKTANRLTLTLRNKLPHNLPTGAPFRNIYIKVMAFNDAGEVVWRNAKGHPLKEDKQSVLWYRLGDDQNKNAPPPKATKVLGDSRLKPHEVRDIEYLLPKEGISRIEAKAYYSLLLPGNIRSFNTQLPEYAKQPKLIGAAAITL